jgi:hypothetical protein
MKPCTQCGEPIETDVVVCPRCGGQQPASPAFPLRVGPPPEPPGFKERWWRGLVLSLRINGILVIAWGLPLGIGPLITAPELAPEWLRITLFVLWVILILLFCPVLFESLAHVTGLAPRKGAAITGEGLAAGQEPGAPATPPQPTAAVPGRSNRR